MNPQIVKCPKCNSNDLYKAGFVLLSTGKKQLYQCKKCGRKFRGKEVYDY